MSLKTKIFGKKLGREELTNLMKVLKINKNILNNDGEKWTTQDYWGKCLVIPHKDGLNVDLYVFRRDYHILEGEDFRRRKDYGEKVLTDCKSCGDKEFDTSKFHYQEKIPYNKINL